MEIFIVRDIRDFNLYDVFETKELAEKFILTVLVEKWYKNYDDFQIIKRYIRKDLNY